MDDMVFVPFIVLLCAIYTTIKMLIIFIATALIIFLILCVICAIIDFRIKRKTR